MSKQINNFKIWSKKINKEKNSIFFLPQFWNVVKLTLTDVLNTQTIRCCFLNMRYINISYQKCQPIQVLDYGYYYVNTFKKRKQKISMSTRMSMSNPNVNVNILIWYVLDSDPKKINGLNTCILMR